MEVTLYGPYNSSETGPSRVHSGLACGLTKLGLDVEMVVKGDKTDPPMDGIKVTSVGSDPGNVLGFYRLQWRAKRHVRRRDPDIFHSVGGMAFPADVRTVHSVMEDLDLRLQNDFEYQHKDLQGLLGEILLTAPERVSASLRGKTVVQSPLAAKRMERFWRRSPDTVLPLGIHEEELCPSEPVSSPVKILFPNRLMPRKGHHRVLRHLDPDATGYEVDLVGSEKRPEYFDIFRDRWEHRYHGFVSRDRLDDFFRRSDISLVPSYHENFSISALEACARGTALIISDSSGLAHFDEVRNCDGVTVVSNGEQAAAEARRLVESPAELQKQKEACYELATGFTWKNVAEMYSEIYAQLV